MTILGMKPGTPKLPILIGVAFPDLLWPAMVLLNLEQVEINQESPLQKEIKFIKYPYSHSLVMTAAIALIPAVALALYYHSWLLGLRFCIPLAARCRGAPYGHACPRFWKGCQSRIGIVEKWPGFFYHRLPGLCCSGAVFLYLKGIAIFHLLNSNSFFGFSKTNLIKSSKGYALFTLVGFIALILALNSILK